jgi:hypothetical protein
LSGTSYTKVGSESGATARDTSIYITGNTDYVAMNGEYEVDDIDQLHPKWTHTLGVYEIEYDNYNILTTDHYGYGIKLVSAADPIYWIGDDFPLPIGTDWYTYDIPSSGAWGYYVGDMILELGRNGAAYDEDSVVTINGSAQAFTSDGGSVVLPDTGEMKKIINTPLESGLFKTTVVTRTAYPQRVPPIGGMFEYTSNGAAAGDNENGIIIGRNQPMSQVTIDKNFMATRGGFGYGNSNSMSVSINEYGLYDYTMLSNKPL